MKKLLFVLTAVVFLSLPWAPTADAGGPYDVTENYYSDSGFWTAVGWTEQFCDDTFDYGGTFTNYKMVDVTNCTNQNVRTFCQQWNSSTSSWETIECPPPAADGRLRIPGGSPGS